MKGKISLIANFLAAHPKLLTFGLSLTMATVLSLATGFTDHYAYARIEEQNTLRAYPKSS
jgi:hypothetical protein